MSEPEQMHPSEGRAPRLGEALIPVVTLIVFLAANVRLYGGTPHIPLLIGASVASMVGLGLGYRWKTIEQGMVDGIVISLRAILILVIIWVLIGTWIAAGTVPLRLSSGLSLLTPEIFLFISCLICAIVSLATGSSWTTAGTVGVALIGVGKGLEVPLPMVAGAIISGSYFGDKISPLSDTTNLAPAVAGSEIFEHIRHMMYTTIPGLAIALILYAFLGKFYISGPSEGAALGGILPTLEANFNLSPLLLIPFLLVILLVVAKVPALPALVLGAVCGGLVGGVLQGLSMGEVFAVAKDGYISSTGNESVDSLLSRGGISGMLNTIALILCAMAFGGAMERTGMLRVLANTVLRLARTTGSLVAATVGTCLGMNAVAPDQYLSIVIPGRMYREAFDHAKLHPKNLSRCLEDAGTLSSPLIAYNTCGAYMSEVLGVSASAYFCFAFLNLATPILSVIYGYTGFTMSPSEARDPTRSTSGVPT